MKARQAHDIEHDYLRHVLRTAGAVELQGDPDAGREAEEHNRGILATLDALAVPYHFVPMDPYGFPGLRFLMIDSARRNEDMALKDLAQEATVQRKFVRFVENRPAAARRGRPRRARALDDE